MDFTNDLTKVEKYMKQHHLVRQWNVSPEAAEKINTLAAVCMQPYGRAHGDKHLIGWFPFRGVFEKDGSVAFEDRHADGFVMVPTDAPEDALIGIREELLLSAPMQYLVYGVGLHEVCHLRYEQHDDDFSQYLLYLQYDLAAELQPTVN